MLKVQKPGLHPPRNLSESEFEIKIAKIMGDLGIWSYHVNEKMYQGVPDRYVVGGRWIEFKQCALRYHISPMRLFRQSQRTFLTKFLEVGDKPYACILFQFRSEQRRAVLKPWSELLHEGDAKWDEDRINAEGYLKENWDKMVKEALL
jgi:hypothetical protein